MNNACGAVAPPDTEAGYVGDTIRQRATRRGLVQIKVRSSAGAPEVADAVAAMEVTAQSTWKE
jgi:hypothetical protein